MKRMILTTLTVLLALILSHGQTNRFERLSFILGEWSGTGSGFGNKTSVIESSFQLVMEGKYIEVINDSRVEPTETKPDSKHHIDKGFISFDKNRNSIIFRQFNVEGYINQYLLVDSLSNESLLVFETEMIENFEPERKARWTIKKLSESQIETTFDVLFPDNENTCIGTNILQKKDRTMSETIPKVTGIGGIFFFSDNPNETKEWYSKHLGLQVNEWGSSFEFRNANRPEEINYLQWSPFKKGSEYFAPSEKEFMINYRVQNIEGLVSQLKESGVTIVDEIESYEYGKFVHIMDPEGNKIELWEPVDSVFTKMGGETTK